MHGIYEFVVMKGLYLSEIGTVYNCNVHVN